MSKVNIEFTLFSAFYSPLISTMTGGFLTDEGLEYEWRVSAPGVSAIESLKKGEADVVQSTLSQGFTSLNKGQAPGCVHFAQVNGTDGFFITARAADDSFDWHKLEGADVLVHHGGQPMTMFRYGCHKAGIDINKINIIDAGNGAQMDKAFREGMGDYIHQQGPAPQQLQADGQGYVVAALGTPIGRCAFSSLASTPEFLNSDIAPAFTRAFARAKAYLCEASAAEIAAAQKPLFPNIDEAVLADCIASYQEIGCWRGSIDITPQGYEAMLDIFDFDNKLKARYAYDQICASPPRYDI